MSAAQQAPVVLPFKKGIVKQVSRKRKCVTISWLFPSCVPTQHLKSSRNMIFHVQNFIH